MNKSRISDKQFREACSRFATGVAIATVMEDENRAFGLTISSFTSVSLEPPLVLFCLHHQSQLKSHFSQSGTFGINILSANQDDLSARFANRNSHQIHPSDWHPGYTGVPVLVGSLATFECKSREKIVCGDHDIFIGEVVAVSVEDGAPLVRYQSSYCRLEDGKSARGAQ